MALRHLILIIPGIAGSVLQTSDGTPVWGQGRSSSVRSLTNPVRLNLAEQPELIATDVFRDIAFFKPFPWAIHGYSGLINAITSTFAGATMTTAVVGADPEPADVLLYPYDFRLGVIPAAHLLKAEMDARLNGLTSDGRRRRVIVVAHSMGGLVARYWLGPLGGASDCRALITLGTPHRGAPKALDWLVNGVRVGPVTVGGVTDVLRDWPSMYDLLPRYRMIRQSAGGPLYPHELGGDLAGPGFGQAARSAFDMHEQIEQAWAALDPTTRPEMTAMFARGHPTVASAELVGSTLRTGKADPAWLPNAGWAGDGTVPAISAVPIECSEERRSWTAVTDRHGRLPSSQTVIEVLKNYLGESLTDVRNAGVPGRPWLGLDLDDMVLAAQPFTVGATLLGTPAENANVPVWVTIRANDTGRKMHEAQLEPVGDRMLAQVPGLAPGDYRVEVRAVGLPGHDQIVCADLLAVLDAT